jgi:hypothetical protein
MDPPLVKGIRRRFCAAKDDGAMRIHPSFTDTDVGNPLDHTARSPVHEDQAEVASRPRMKEGGSRGQLSSRPQSADGRGAQREPGKGGGAEERGGAMPQAADEVPRRPEQQPRVAEDLFATTIEDGDELVDSVSRRGAGVQAHIVVKALSPKGQEGQGVSSPEEGAPPDRPTPRKPVVLSQSGGRSGSGSLVEGTGRYNGFTPRANVSGAAEEPSASPVLTGRGSVAGDTARQLSVSGRASVTDAVLTQSNVTVTARWSALDATGSQPNSTGRGSVADSTPRSPNATGRGSVVNTSASPPERRLSERR